MQSPVARSSSPPPVSYAITAVLLLSAFVALLWVPSYAHLTPTLGGIPFFYWYSLLWLVINAICQIAAYWLIVVLPRRNGGANGGGAHTATADRGGK